MIVQGPLELVPEAELRRQFEVNVYGPANVMRAFLPLVRKGKGRIVNISAPTARTAIPFLAPISASKAALESLSDAARVELAPWDIPVVLIQPGAMATAIFDKAGAAARTALAEAPAERRTLYGKQLEALDKMLAGQRLSPVTAVVDAIVRAVEARRPRPRYVVGADARALVMLSRLPTRLRDKLLTRTLGLA
ncbi:SDR family NAD(P)-dependent oxidoreductase [Nonomuraea sp. SMC257]|uniref:SDR family NAD(P)-dependent oxidoreductase n=1 Tax=Nonomuraea montanisoli TaxID=2741721 RepID=A0A7Y6M3M8_9ACTN|nr:SDR family NAD(P)-dependent oxidoreductase [Nonomuraea montanisoli]NUW32615.1 SDR family NAD(P)-dependent oxidoreductase [Nonomuraea montanisoli]